MTDPAPAPRPSDGHGDGGFESVSELASATAGASSPFGEVEFPLPIDAVGYVHPRPDDKPYLAGE